MRPRLGIWIKPMLDATRRDVEADLARIGQPWCEDATNRDLRYARNRVRHVVVPALAEVAIGRQPPIRRRSAATTTHGTRAALPDDSARARAALARKAARTAAEAREAALVIKRWIRSRRSSFRRIEPHVVQLDSSRVGLYPVGIQRALFRWLWKQVSPSGVGLTRAHVEALVKLVQNQRPNARVELPSRLAAVHDGSQLLMGALPRGTGGRAGAGR